MSVAEIGLRGRQEGSKWFDRLRPGSAGRDARAILEREAPALAAPGQAIRLLRETFDERFIEEDGLAARPEPVEQIVAEATRTLTGRFDLLGYRGLDFGDPINWHLDPVSGRRSPLTHWSRINPLDPSVVGDSKVVWELNRHQWMVPLAQATLATADSRYAACALDRMSDWIQANPAGRGINWASSLEVSFRLISWTWVLALLRHTDAMQRVDLTAVLASLHAHASHVEKFLSSYYSPNTHLTGEALGLCYAGCLYPQFADAARWRQTGAATLIAETGRQISSDGIYFEQSTCYQRYTCEIYLHFLALARRSGIDIPADLPDRVGSLAEFLADVSVDGVMPNIGDADGGWLLPLSRRDAGDCRGTLAAAASILGRTFDVDSMHRGSRLFRDGGYAVLRSGEHQAIVDVGPVGAFGHGHADLLSLQLRIFGEECLVDPGTYSYTTEPEWRDHFRGTAAHNTVTIDGLDQALPHGPFGWQSRPSAEILDYQSTAVFDLIEARHDAYGGITHRRRVLATTDGPFVVIDDLLGEGSHEFAMTWQFAPMGVELMSDCVAIATTPRGHRLSIMPFTSAPLKAQVFSGETNPIRGWISPVYGQKTPAPVLVYSSAADFPVRIITVLYPQR